jgi:hypothetical protein
MWYLIESLEHDIRKLRQKDIFLAPLVLLPVVRLNLLRWLDIALLVSITLLGLATHN